MPDLYLEFCSSGDSRYVEIRKDHYVPSVVVWPDGTLHKKGAHGQQVHFLIWHKQKIVGIISGGGAVFATEVRDSFFKINKGNRTKVLNGIVDNIVFRLIDHERNLGSRVLSLWEKVAAHTWELLYGVKVFGFETFIVREGLMREVRAKDKTHSIVICADPEGNIRHGAMYKAANWFHVGTTKGSSKGHDEVGLTGGIGKNKEGGGKGSFIRKQTPIKDVYCKWLYPCAEPIESVYKSSWKAATVEGTPEEKEIAKQKSSIRKGLIGKRFYAAGRRIENF